MAEEKRAQVVTLSSLSGGSAVKEFEPTPVYRDSLVKDSLPDVPAAQNREARASWYHLGVLPGCPHQTVHVSARGEGFKVSLAFTRAAETVLLDRGSGTTTRSLRRGDFARLTKEEFDAIVARVKTKAIRWQSKADCRGFVVDMVDKRYQRSSMDEPLGRFLYCKLVDEQEVMRALEPLVGDEAVPLVMDDGMAPEPEVAAAATGGNKAQRK